MSITNYDTGNPIDQLAYILPPEDLARMRLWPKNYQQQYLDAYFGGHPEQLSIISQQADAATGTGGGQNTLPPGPNAGDPAFTNQPNGGTPPPVDTTGAADQGKYSQAIDEAARSDPSSFVSWVLGQNGGDPNGNNPLSAAALRRANLFPYSRLLFNGYQNAPLYNFGDALEQSTKNMFQPGAAGGGTGTAYTFGQGTNALRGMLSSAASGNGPEYDALNGNTPTDTANNLKTYYAAAYADNLDPIYQRAMQNYVDRQKTSYYNDVYNTGNAGESFLDWMNQHGTSYAS